MPVSLSDSFWIILTPRSESPSILGSNCSVSLQPMIAVSGVLSSCDICEMNSVVVLSDSAIFEDMRFISSVS